MVALALYPSHRVATQFPVQGAVFGAIGAAARRPVELALESEPALRSAAAALVSHLSHRAAIQPPAQAAVRGPDGKAALRHVEVV